MAEAFLRSMAPETHEAFSAGLEPGEINPLTREVMAEVSLDLAGQSSKSVSQYMGRMHFGYMITVCDQAEKQCPSTFPGVGSRLHWSFEDPAAFVGTPEERLESFRQARDDIRARIEAWLLETRPKGSGA